MPRVISYTRFSSARQAAGDSYRRQTEMALKWCKENDLVLDTELSLEDLGVSGYSGANAKHGALGVLRVMLLNGDIEPGTILLIEAFDRLTRMSLPDAYELLFSLVNNGLTIVTLTDNKTWTKDALKDLGSFMMSMVLLYRGHEESKQKSKRLRDTFEEARKKSKKESFGTAPGWLYREAQDQPWQVDDIKAESVRKVFELSALGYGSKMIAKRANEEKWPIPTRETKARPDHWHGRMPGQILRNRAVLGEREHRIRTHDSHEYHWKGLSTGMVIPDYFPRIVSDELWNRAHASIVTRMVARRRDTQYFNIWSGLMYCGYCGAPIQRRSERTGYSKGQNFCSDRIAGLTECPSSAVITSDPCLLDNIYKYGSSILGSKAGEQLSARAAELEALIKSKSEESARIAIAIAKTRASITALTNKAIEIESEMRAAQEELEEVRRNMAIQDSSPTFDDTFLFDAMSFIYIPDDPVAKEKRAELHLKLNRLIDHILIWSYEVAMVKYRNENFYHVVPLNPKRLPSRANPSSRWHKPPPPPNLKPTPHLDAALRGELIPPEPKIRSPLVKKRKSYKDEVVLDDDMTVDDIEDSTSLPRRQSL